MVEEDVFLDSATDSSCCHLRTRAHRASMWKPFSRKLVALVSSMDVSLDGSREFAGRILRQIL